MPSKRLAKNLRRRGTASVEVVMMLPVFIVAFFGLYWMHSHYMARQQAMSRARSCGWVYAAGACEDKDGLKKCLENDGREDASEDSATGLKAKAGGSASGKWPAPAEGQSVEPQDLNQPEQQELEQHGPPLQASGGVGGSKTTAVLSKLEGLPLIGGAIKWLFGKPVTIYSDEPMTAPTPVVMSEEVEGTVTGHYSTLCNAKPQSWRDLAKDIFCQFVVKFPGC
jgi:hypothetical protein